MQHRDAMIRRIFFFFFMYRKQLIPYGSIEGSLKLSEQEQSNRLFENHLKAFSMKTHDLPNFELDCQETEILTLLNMSLNRSIKYRTTISLNFLCILQNLMER